jgi:hypothetical protein
MVVVLRARFSGIDTLFEVSNMHVTFGRGDGVHVQVPDANCSRAHCKFYVSGRELWIEDMNSKNGTRVNGIRVQKLQVFSKDKILVGDTEITVPTSENTVDVLKVLTFSGDTQDRVRKGLSLQDTSEFTQARLNPLTAIHTVANKDPEVRAKLQKDPLFKNAMLPSRMSPKEIAAKEPIPEPPSWMEKLSSLTDSGGALLAFIVPLFLFVNGNTDRLNFSTGQFIGFSKLLVLIGVCVTCSFVFWLVNTKNSGGSIGERLLEVLWYKKFKKRL